MKKLYLISTNQVKWGLYDQAIFCATSKKEAIELSEEAMSVGFETYKNTAIKIGRAKKTMPIGEVCSSFNVD